MRKEMDLIFAGHRAYINAITAELEMYLRENHAELTISEAEEARGEAIEAIEAHLEAHLSLDILDGAELDVLKTYAVGKIKATYATVQMECGLY